MQTKRTKEKMVAMTEDSMEVWGVGGGEEKEELKGVAVKLLMLFIWRNGNHKDTFFLSWWVDVSKVPSEKFTDILWNDQNLFLWNHLPQPWNEEEFVFQVLSPDQHWALVCGSVQLLIKDGKLNIVCWLGFWKLLRSNYKQQEMEKQQVADHKRTKARYCNFLRGAMACRSQATVQQCSALMMTQKNMALSLQFSQAPFHILILMIPQGCRL